jgi:hypothetical protein
MKGAWRSIGEIAAGLVVDAIIGRPPQIGRDSMDRQW